MKRLILGALVGCALLLMPCQSDGLEVSDFIRMDGAHTWQLEGTATYMGFPINLSGSLTSSIMSSVFDWEHDAIQFMLLVNGGGYTMNHDLTMRLTEETLYLEYRSSALGYNGTVIDSDYENYREPADILPRIFSRNTEYEYTAKLLMEDVLDSVLIGDFEPRTTAQGWEVEALRVDFFTKDEQPLTIWFARDIGFVEIQMQMEAGSLPIVANLKLVGDPATWDPEPGTGIWEDTINLGGGWRDCDTIGTIWIPSIDSSWVSHYGLDWIYCTGDDTSMFSYVPGIDWIWTQCGLYPILYVYDEGGWMYYPESPGNRTFWDYTSSTWKELPPIP